jgi:hypothetical protein
LTKPFSACVTHTRIHTHTLCLSACVPVLPFSDYALLAHTVDSAVPVDRTRACSPPHRFGRTWSPLVICRLTKQHQIHLSPAFASLALIPSRVGASVPMAHGRDVYLEDAMAKARFSEMRLFPGYIPAVSLPTMTPHAYPHPSALVPPLTPL